MSLKFFFGNEEISDTRLHVWCTDENDPVSARVGFNARVNSREFDRLIDQSLI